MQKEKGRVPPGERERKENVILHYHDAAGPRLFEVLDGLEVLFDPRVNLVGLRALQGAARGRP